MLYLPSGLLFVGSSGNQLKGFVEEDRRHRKMSCNKNTKENKKTPKTTPQERPLLGSIFLLAAIQNLFLTTFPI